MDQIDRDNLQFILSTGAAELEIWYAGLTQAQKVYASRLLDVYKEELNHKAILVSDPFVVDCSSAKNLLKQFTLGK